jgi:hypothetical protein
LSRSTCARSASGLQPLPALRERNEEALVAAQANYHAVGLARTYGLTQR